MIVYVQDKLIRYFLNPASGFAERMSEKTRERMFQYSCLMIILMHFLYTYLQHYSGVFPIRYLYVFAFDCLMLALMAFSTLRGTLRPVRFDPVLLVCILGIGVFTLIAAVTKDIKHLAAAILSLLVYPAIYVIWNNHNDVDTILRWLSRSCRLSFFVFLLIHFLFYPVTRKYGGLFYNPNGMASYLTLVFCFLWAELLLAPPHENAKSNILLIGVCVSLMFCTASRTGLYSIFAAALFSLVLLFFSDRARLRSFCVRHLPVILLCCLVLFPVTVYVSYIPAVLRALLLDPTGGIGWKMFVSVKDILSGIIQTNFTKIAVGGRSAVRYSAGRLDIWKGYMSHIRFWGHSYGESFPLNKEGVMMQSSTAHNTPLEFAWRYGIPAGLSLLVFNIYAGIRSIQYVIQAKNQPHTLLIFIIAIAYGLTSMLASLNTLVHMLGAYYVLVQFPLITSADKIKRR